MGKKADGNAGGPGAVGALNDNRPELSSSRSTFGNYQTNPEKIIICASSNRKANGAAIASMAIFNS